MKMELESTHRKYLDYCLGTRIWSDMTTQYQDVSGLVSTYDMGMMLEYQ